MSLTIEDNLAYNEDLLIRLFMVDGIEMYGDKLGSSLSIYLSGNKLNIPYIDNKKMEKDFKKLRDWMKKHV